MKTRIAAAAIAATTSAAMAGGGDLTRVASPHDVATTTDRLEAAATNAGATVFARVDHTKGAEKVGLSLRDEELLIFGNPKLGTPAMQDDANAGLFLPLRVLVYKDDDGQVWLTYQDPAAMLSGLDIPADAPYIAKMTGALGKLTAAAASE